MAKLTVKELQAIGTERAGEKIRDEGGLVGVIRARTEGVSVKFDWRYRFGGKVRTTTCGTWPKDSLADIRAERDRLRRMLEEGRDPAEEKQAQRLKQKADQAEAIAREKLRIANLEAQAARMTVKGLFERWERLELAGRKDKGAEVRRCFEKDVFPELGDVAAADVTRPMIANALDKVAQRGARIVARNLLGDLRQMYGFGIVRGLVEHDPTSHMKRDDFGRKVERDRVLSDTEVKELARKLPLADMWDSSQGAIWIMLSTCCRVGEISQARIADVDLKTGEWRIPPDNSKNGKAHTIHLSEFAKGHFRTLIERAQRLKKECPWVFPAKNGEGHVDVKSLAKQIGDRQRGAEEKPMKGRTPLVEALVLPGGKWTPHDLRRTGATLMGRLGVRPDVIEKCLNHVEQNRLVRIYQRQELREEQREAWRLLGERLELLTRTETDNVFVLHCAS